MDVSLEIRTESIAAAPRVNIDEARTSRYGPRRTRKEKELGQEGTTDNNAYKVEITKGYRSPLSEAFSRLSSEQMEIFRAGVLRGRERMHKRA